MSGFLELRYSRNALKTFQKEILSQKIGGLFFSMSFVDLKKETIAVQANAWGAEWADFLKEGSALSCHACLRGGKCDLRMASCALSTGFIDTFSHAKKIIRLSWISNGCARIGLLKEEKGTW